MNTGKYVRGYRFTFQSQESDNEIRGKGNSLNYKFRMHDPRIGRFFAVDPLAAKYPYYTPYSFSGNTVINSIELEGLEPLKVTDPEKKKEVLTAVEGNVPNSVFNVGSTDWNTENPSYRDGIQTSIAINMDIGGEILGMKNASGMLRNYIKGSQDILVADVDYLLDQSNEFSGEVVGALSSARNDISNIIQSESNIQVGSSYTVEQQGSVTFKSNDLYYALGSSSFGVKTVGTVTKLNNKSSGEIEYTIELNSEIFFWDKYDWNKNGDVDLPGGINIDDNNMRRLHTSGLAKEYGVVGYSNSGFSTTIKIVK
jgi:hypothetical protein